MMRLPPASTPTIPCHRLRTGGTGRWPSARPLLELALEQGRVGADGYQAAIDALVREYVVDLPIDENVLVKIAQDQGWRPESVAVALTRAASWVELGPAISIVNRALQNTAADHLPAWAFAALHGLKEASPAASLYPNLTDFTTTLLSEPWARPDHALALALRQLAPNEADDCSDPRSATPGEI